MSDQGGHSQGRGELTVTKYDRAALARTGADWLGGRPVVVVLGMHRSGTSLLSNVLQMLGVDMADTTDAVSPRNPGGFWERPALVAIHDEILAAIGRPIGMPRHVLPFPPAWWRRKEVQALKPKLIDYIVDQLGRSSNLWGFKDPRTCRLLPLWAEIFRELGLRPIYVHAVRNPAESAASMSKRVNKSSRRISLADGELMWLAYNYDIVRYVTSKQATPIVDYDEWFDDGPAVGERLFDQLALGDSLTVEEIAECVSDVVHAEYRHHLPSDARPGEGLPAASMLYKALTACRTDGDPHSTLRGSLKMAELTLTSIKPLVDDLEAGIAEQADKEQETEAAATALRERMAELEAGYRQTIDKLQAAREMLAEEKQRATATSHQRRRSAALLRGAKGWRDRSRLLEAEARLASAQLVQATEANELLRDRYRRRAEYLLQTARQWRSQAAALEQEVAAAKGLYEASHSGRIETAEREAEQRRIIEDLQRQLRLSEERAERAGEAWSVQERTIARLRSDLSAQPRPNETGVFAWPVSSDELEQEAGGRIIRTDSVGIHGEAHLRDPQLVPIIELRVDHDLVLAVQCQPRDSESGGRPWHFVLPWRSIGLGNAGREAIVRIAGIGMELGRCPIPENLRTYQLPPAEMTAALLGGTAADAAKYHRWLAEYQSDDELESARGYLDARKSPWPTITVIVHGSDHQAIDRTIGSLRSQVYQSWEALCIDSHGEVGGADPRITAIASSDLAGHLSRYPGDALFTFVRGGDLIAPTALLHLGDAAVSQPDFALIYSDEDRIDPGTGLRAAPYMKGAWSPDLAMAQDYVSRLAMVRRSSIDQPASIDENSIAAITRGAALSKAGPIIHRPFPLYHRSMDKLAAGSGHDAATADEVDRLARRADALVPPLPEPLPRVSLIVPTRDRVDLLRVAVDGFLHESSYSNLEVLIADNGSEEEETRAYLAEIAHDPRVKIVPCPGPFNYSAINNQAASQATGDLIGLMNNDLKVIDADWLKRMASQAMRPEIGIVGAKLLYGDDTVQHAGVTLGRGLATHLYRGFPAAAEGHHGRLILPQDLSAVTAACLLMRREVWDAVGGLDEDFPVAYNDVDLCLKVAQAGYRILWDPEVLLYHLESQSRGKDQDGAKKARLEEDKRRLQDRWGDRLNRDPFHSPNLTIAYPDARLAFPPLVAAPWRRPRTDSPAS